jgi:hypothetical protein
MTMNKQEIIKALEPFPDDVTVLMAIESEGMNYPIEGASLEEDYEGKPYVALNEDMRT